MHGDDRLRMQDSSSIQDCAAVLIVNCRGRKEAVDSLTEPSPMSPSALAEAGVAAYLGKAIYLLHPSGDTDLEKDLNMVSIQGNLSAIPKEILG